MSNTRSGGTRTRASGRRFDLLFAVSGGSADGLGHVMRCATIALEAQRRGLQVGFHLRGDDGALRVLEEQLPGVAIERVRSLDGAPVNAQWLILDTRDEIANALRQARRAGVHRLVLDRADHVDEADWTVLPALHAPAMAHPRVRGGPRWCVIAPAFRALAVPPWPDGRESVLVSFGGADPLDLTSRVAESLNDALAHPDTRGLSVDVVLGSSFRDRERLESRLRLAGFRVHAPLTRRCMCSLMARARIAIAGFGTTLAELAFMGVPAVTITHHEDDLPHAARLEALGVARCAGFGGRFDAPRFTDLLRTTLHDRSWCARASTHARTLLADGRGDGRILDLLSRSSRRRTPAPAQASA